MQKYRHAQSRYAALIAQWRRNQSQSQGLDMIKMIAFGLTGMAACSTALAQTNGAFLVPVSAPTLSEIGLGALVVLVGALGAFLVRRKK
jgi:hypothetical protein